MPLSDILTFFYSQLFVKPEYPTTSFAGQTVIVTGANTGLGFEGARHFARLGAHVILAARSTSKGEAARKDIIQSTGRKESDVELWLLDLSNFESVKAFAEKVKTLDRLDVIVENAGISTNNFALAEGHESTITVNVISTFLLALLVLPKLRETATKYNIIPRLTIVSSEVHAMSQLSAKKEKEIFPALSDEKKAAMSARYFDSKLLEVLYVRKLAPVMAQSGKPGVTLNMLNPGLCQSTLATRDGESFGVKVLLALLARTTEVGGRTLVASAAAGHETHGEYFSNGVVTKTAAWPRSKEGEATGERVWQELNEILEKIEPGVTRNI